MSTAGFLPWDPSYVDPTDRPADGLLIRSVGGRTGPISLENGAALSFPWKAQQEKSGTTPSQMYVYEGVSGGNTVEITVLRAATLNDIATANQPTLQLSSSYTNGDAGQVFLGMGNEPYILLARVAGVATIQLKGATDIFGAVNLDGNLTATGTIQGNVVNSVTTITANGNIQAGALSVTGLATLNGGINASGGTVSLVSSAANPVSITAGTGVNIVAGDDVVIQGGGAAGAVQITAVGTGNAVMGCDVGGTAQVQGGIANLVSTASTVAVQAVTTVTVASGSGGYILLNNGNERTVSVNGYPALALRDRENAAFGTPPAVTAAVTGFKMQAGRQIVNFVAGAGVLTFLSPFATGLVNVVATAEANDTVIAINPGGGVNAASIALTAFVGGVAMAGNVWIDYMALGW